jgi:hypothetical protein
VARKPSGYDCKTEIGEGGEVMNSEYLRYLENELREAYKELKNLGDDAEYCRQLKAKIKHLCSEIYDLEMSTRWNR